MPPLRAVLRRRGMPVRRAGTQLGRRRPGHSGTLTRKAANFTKPMGLTVNLNDITYRNVAGVAGTIILRLIIGPFAEQYGVRLAVTFILVVTCIPGFLVDVSSTRP